MKPCTFQWTRFVLAGLAAIAFAGASGAARASDPAAAARAILKESGIRGGLIVHLGCGDGHLTAALRAGEGYLVHGLDRDDDDVAAARRHVRSLGLYGPVAVERLDGARLPHADNLVNLLVVEDSDAVPADERMRVLAPEGVAMVRESGAWRKTIKPRPATLGRWTHYLHGPDNNAVTDDDAFGPPRHLQWVAAPRWARSHEHLSSFSAMVTCGRRVFTIVDEGPAALVALEPDWQLLARDAFSGVLLWKRPIGRWEGHLRDFRSGPTELPRRLVASADRLFVTLRYGGPLTALDPATGETLVEYPHTDGALEVLHDNGALLVVTGTMEAEPEPGSVRRFGPVHPPRNRRLVALDAGTGAVRWERADDDTSELMPVTLAVAGGRVVFQNPRAIVCLDAATGRPHWRAERPISVNRPAWSTPTLVMAGDVILSADRQASPPAGESAIGLVDWTIGAQGGEAPEGEMIAFSAATGERLWSAPCRESYNAPVDVLVIDGLVWSGFLVKAKEPGITVARDIRTGEVARRRSPDQDYVRIGMSHHRCYRNKATGRFLVLGRSGVELVDIESGDVTADHWVRGACQYGVMPANGLLYAPPHSCACFIETKLNGFNALASGPEAAGDGTAQPPASRLQRGPAYDEPIAVAPAQPGDWPTYRRDAARTGATDEGVRAALVRRWSTDLGGRLSPVVVADGKLWVAQIDAHTLHALDADTGRPAWAYTAGGRINSPPTVWQGRVLFGSADGWIYCLRSDDGRLVWRFRAAPDERRIVAYDQLESAWPLHGNVLVQDGVIFAAAGRSSFLDGGILLVRLDASTGGWLSETRLDQREPDTGRTPQDIVQGFDMPGYLPDVLSADGDSVFMRHSRFDASGQPVDERAPHLFSPAGFLDDSWWHRTYWFFGTKMFAGWGNWPRAGEQLPSGRLLVHDGETVFGYGRTVYARHGSHVGLPQAFLDEVWPLTERRPSHYRLFAAPLDRSAAAAQQEPRKKPAKGAEAEPQRAPDRWSIETPMMVRAMVRAGSMLFLAGPPEPFATNDPVAAWKGRRGGMLHAVSTAEGHSIAEYSLPSPPVFDGMAAAGGRLYLATLDGRVTCMAHPGKGD